MDLFFLLGLPILLFGALAILLVRSRRAGQAELARKGKLTVGVVLEHDSDNLLSVKFTPDATTTKVVAVHRAGGSFSPGDRVAVRYNPLCPWVNGLALDIPVQRLERTDQPDAAT